MVTAGEVAHPLPRGVMTAMVTPVHDGGRIDDAGLDRLVDRVVAGGVAGLSPCGSTGEGSRLTPDERMHVVRRVRARVGTQVAVVPGVPVTAVSLARDELVELGSIGATAALVPPPSFYPCDDAELARLYTMLADDSPVPLVLYNIPSFTGVPLTVSVVLQLAAHPNIVGIKDSSRNVEYLQSLILAADGEAAESGRLAVYTGADTLLLASLLIGADGAIAASSNLVPELGVGIVEAFNRGDIGTAQRFQRQLIEVVTACRQGPFPSGWKAALQLAGVCEAEMLPPAAPLPQPLLRQLALQLAQAESRPQGMGAAGP